MSNVLRIGLLAQNTLQQHALRNVIKDSGHDAEICLLTSQLPESPNELEPAQLVGINSNTGELPSALNVDAWLVVTGDEQDNDYEGDVVDDWLEKLKVPAIICDGAVPATHDESYPAWARRMVDKLKNLAGTINLERATEVKARQVWVLAASTGGPAAVKDFMSALPPGLGIGFIYVQHIDRGFDETLAKAISKYSHYPAKLVQHGDVVEENTVAIVPPDKATEILENGTFEVSNQPWRAPYSPSVDCVVASVAHVYPQRCGVIIFTGMGDDGAASCRLMHQKGGKVWVQTPGSCTSDSMPQAALKQGCVDYKGTPYALAQQLMRVVQAEVYHSQPVMRARPAV